nr:reverse transcriptase domain-containing protein [Tanacetum cinerariifolium]
HLRDTTRLRTVRIVPGLTTRLNVSSLARPVAGQNGLGISNKNENAYLKKNNDDGNKASSSINKQVASTSNGFSILSEDTFIADDGITADSVKESTWQRQETMDSDGDDVKNVYDETGTFIRSDVHKTKGASTPISDVSNVYSELAKLTHVVNQQTSAVTTAMMAMLKQFQSNPPPAQVKAVEEICVTCGGSHPYYQCLAAGGNTFPEYRDNIQGYVSAATGNFNQGNPGYVLKQKFDESFHEAWERYKDLLRACPQLDTFYNALNPADQDSLNAAAGGNLLEKSPQDALTIIENKSKCLAAGGNTFPEYRDNIQGYVSAATGNFNQGNLGYRLQGVANQMRPLGSRTLPGNTIANPKGELKAITTHSGLVIEGPTTPNPPKPVNLEEDECQEKDDIQIQKFWNMFKQLHLNITLAEAFVLMPKYQKMLKALLTNKEKLQELANTHLNENCSTVILKKLPKKLGDPGKFLISCGFSELKCKALADLGASINLMALFVWRKLGLPDLIPTQMTLELANRAIRTPDGIIRDVFVPIGKFTFSADFVVFNYESDPRVPLILGRPFLRTARALIDVHGEEMILCDGDERLTLNMKHETASYSNHPYRESRSYLKKLPEKLGDPGKFLIPCGFSEIKCKALADLGASINLMPLSVWKKLGLPDLIPTQMTLELANRAICTPDEIARDVFVPVGRPFLRTARALIDVHGKEMILCDGDERLTLNMKHDTASYSNHPYRDPDLVSNKQSGNPIFSLHKEIASPEVIPEIHDSKGCTFLSKDLPDIDSFNDIHPYFDDDPLSKDSDFKHSIDQSVLTHCDDLFVDPTPKMFIEEQPPDYSFPPRFDVYPDDFLEIESDAKFDDDSFDSGGNKSKRLNS